MNKKIYYNFVAWTNGKESNYFSDKIELYSKSLNGLIKKIKLFNNVSCFECWSSITFYKWTVTILENNAVDINIVDACHFPQMINAHKIKLWGKTYEI